MVDQPGLDSVVAQQSLRILTTAVVLAIASAAPVAKAAADTAEVIDEIQVTASRRAASTRSVTPGVTVVPEASFADDILITDALEARAGVFLQETTPGQGAAIIRGLKGSQILHLVDGLRLNNAIFRSAPTQYLALIDTASVRSVEVVRGSAGSLYGNDALGGVVQIISRQPDLSGKDFQLKGDINSRLNSADLLKSVQTTVEVGTEDIATLVSASYLTTGTRRTGDGRRIPYTGFTSKAARIAVAAAPTEDERWNADLQFLQQPGTPRVDELVPGFGETEPGSSENEFSPNERAFARVGYRRDNGPWAADWRVDLGWQRVVDDRTTRDFQSDLRETEKNRSDLLGLSINAAKTLAQAQLIFGAEWYHDTVRSSKSDENIVTGARTSLQSRFPDDASVNQRALFTRVQRGVYERSELFAGLRLSDIDIDLPATGLSPAASIGITDVSGEVGWRFSVSNNLDLVANAGRGFRAPNVFDLGTIGNRPGNRFNIPNASLDRERVTQFDVGIKAGGRNWSAELFYFNLRYDDRITSVATGNLTPEGREITQSQNVASSDIGGLETAGTYHFGANVQLDWLVTYTRGEERLGAAGTTPADRIPPTNGRVGLRYDAGTDWSFASFLKFAAEQDRLSARDIRDPRINPDGTPGWVTLGFGATYQPDDQWHLSATAENLLDKTYRSHGSGIDSRGLNLIVGARYFW